MIQQETLPGTDWYRTWSDLGKNILQVETGIVYGEAIDHVSNSFTYEEIETEADKEELSIDDTYIILTGEEEAPENAEEIVNIILGRSVGNDQSSSDGISEDD